MGIAETVSIEVEVLEKVDGICVRKWAAVVVYSQWIHLSSASSGVLDRIIMDHMIMVGYFLIIIILFISLNDFFFFFLSRSLNVCECVCKRNETVR